MVRRLRWHCPPDIGFEIRALAVWGRARYLSVTEAPNNTDYYMRVTPGKCDDRNIHTYICKIILNLHIFSFISFYTNGAEHTDVFSQRGTQIKYHQWNIYDYGNQVVQYYRFLPWPLMFNPFTTEARFYMLNAIAFSADIFYLKYGYQRVFFNLIF